MRNGSVTLSAASLVDGRKRFFAATPSARCVSFRVRFKIKVALEVNPSGFLQKLDNPTPLTKAGSVVDSGSEFKVPRRMFSSLGHEGL